MGRRAPLGSIRACICWVSVSDAVLEMRLRLFAFGVMVPRLQHWFATMRYRGEIDGLRAFAVGPVILFHAGFSVFSGGFVGVDVFFVISGYLITTIIADEIATGRFSIARFYERRARRILPALFVVILACIPFAWWLMDPFEMKEFGQSILGTATFSSNIYFLMKTGYFDTASEAKPLLHTWSLAVEEQFYILFPLLLLALWRFGQKAMGFVIAAVALISLVLAEYLLRTAPSATFFLLHSRAWELCIGALVALHLRNSDQPDLPLPFAQAASLVGLCMILLPVFLYDAATPFPGVTALPPVLGTALVILAAQKGTVTHRLLNARLFVGLGLISYSAYLWHQPILAFVRVYTLDELSQPMAIVGIALSIALAAVTKRFVEDPVRHRVLKTRRALVLGLAAAASVAFAGFGAFVHLRNGLPERSALGLMLAQNYGLSSVCSGAALDDPLCQSGANPRTLLWGDSLAMHLARAVAVAEGGVVQATLSGCPPIDGYTGAARKAAISCEDFNASLMQALAAKRMPQINRVILASTFAALRKPDGLEQFARTITRLQGLGYEVVLVSPTPTNDGILKCIKLQARAGQPVGGCDYRQDEMENTDVFDSLHALSSRIGVPLIDLREMLCDKKICHVSAGQTVFYRDNIHLANGADGLVSDFLTRQFAALNAP